MNWYEKWLGAQDKTEAIKVIAEISLQAFLLIVLPAILIRFLR